MRPARYLVVVALLALVVLVAAGARADGRVALVVGNGTYAARRCALPIARHTPDLALDRAARRRIQHGLQAGGFDPSGANGLFGPRTRGGEILTRLAHLVGRLNRRW